MTLRLTAISMCSGIEAASVASKPLGWRFHAYAEIEAFPSAVLAHHYPNTPNPGDMTKVEWSRYRGLTDVVVAGTPCQAFSVAGIRRGLADARGNLTLTFVEAVNAIDPLYIVWENVPGVLSSKDNAFGCFLAGLAGEDAPLVCGGSKWPNAGVVVGPQRVIAWRVIDAQGFVPQRRRRVFVVATRVGGGGDPVRVLFETEAEVVRHIGGRASAGSLFPEPDSMCGDPAACGEAGEGTAGAVEEGARSGGSTEFLSQSSRIYLPSEVAPTLQAAGLRNGNRAPQVLAFGGGNTRGPLLTAACLTARGVRQDFEVETFVLASEFGSYSEGDDPTLRANGGDCGGGSEALVAEPIAAVCVTGEITHTLNTANNGKGCSEDGTGRGVPTVAVAFQSSQSGMRVADTHATLDANNGSRRHNGVVAGTAVRRLTPLECERLQGFPDGYTLIPTNKRNWARELEEMRDYFRRTHQDVSDDEIIRLAADGPRYKALGNSMAVPVMHWIFARVQRDAERIIAETLNDLL